MFFGVVMKEESKKITVNHKEGAEWLTYEICKEYMHKAQELSGSCGTDIGQRRALRIELQNRCDITELEAINILNGYNISLYVSRYEKMKAACEGIIDSSSEISSKYDAEFIEWLSKKEDANLDKLDDFGLLEDNDD